MPAPFGDFIGQVVRFSRSRGLFRTECGGVTLSDHLGLEPASAKCSKTVSRSEPPEGG